MKLWKKITFAMTFCFALTAILIASGCRTISMRYVDFPVTKLAKFDASTPLTVSSDGASFDVSPSVHVRWVTGNDSSTIRSRMNRVWNQTGTMFVDVLVNGEPCTLILDTGCPVTTLSPNAARRARVPVSDKAFGTLYRIHVEQGDTLMRWGWATNLSIGGYDIQNVPLWVWERQHEVRIFGMPVYHMDGLLGLDVLREFVLTLDMSEPSARFDRSIAPLDASFMKIPFRIEQNRILVAASVNGQPIGECVVDTGASGEVLLSSPIWKGLEFNNSPNE
jgi:predicted aspartyl protease